MKKTKAVLFIMILLCFCACMKEGPKNTAEKSTPTQGAQPPTTEPQVSTPTAVPEPQVSIPPSPTATPKPPESTATGPKPTITLTEIPSVDEAVAEITCIPEFYFGLLGENVMEVERGTVWEDPGIKARDAYGRNIADEVSITGNLDTETCGSYVLKYLLLDESGTEYTLERTVYVRPNEQDVKTAEENGNVIYLTFDDGPSNHTERLLNILKKYDVKATFFVCATGKLKWCSRQLEEGHTVAIHTYTHDYETVYASEEAYFTDLYKIQEAVYNQIGLAPTILRFPGGSSNKVSMKYQEGIMTRLTQAVEEQGFVYFDWNVSCGDGRTDIDTERIIKNVKSGVSGKKVSVVLMHDSHSYTVDAVEDIIVWGLENGYTFLPLSKYSFKAHHNVNN